MSKIKKPAELQTQSLLKVLIYGQPGIGKSTIALSFPSPLMIDCDRGIHRVQPEHLSDTVEVNDWTDIDDVLKENLSVYKTIIFDTGGKLIDFMTDFLKKKNPKFAQGDGTFSLKGYGARKQMFQDLLGRLHIMGKHVVFVAHEKEERDGDNRFIRPEIGGSSGNDLIKELDLVAYMEAIGKKRTIHFNPQDKFYAKNACQLPESMEVPDVTKGNVFMQGIIDRYNKSLAERGEKATEYNELIALINTGVGNAKSDADLNEFMATVQDFEHIWDSKLRASFAIRDKAKTLDLEFKDGKYISKKEPELQMK